MLLFKENSIYKIKSKRILWKQKPLNISMLKGGIKIEKPLARLNARGWCQTTLNEKCEPIKV